MALAYGFIETRGLIAAVEAADAMLKAAKVRLITKQKVGSALITVIVQGDLDACQAAVDAGAAAAERIGELVSTHVIPRPYDDVIKLVNKFDKSGKKRINKNKQTAKPAQKTIITKSKSKDDRQQIIELVSRQSKGATLQQIAEILGKSTADARLLVKKMMDENIIEKVRQHYFLVQRGEK